MKPMRWRRSCVSKVDIAKRRHGEKRISKRDVRELAQTPARRILHRLELRFVADEASRPEQRVERRVQVRIDEGQPLRCLRALLRRTIAGQVCLRIRIGDVAHDRGVLGQHEIAIDDGGHRPGGIDRQVRRLLHLGGRHHPHVERLARPLQRDVVGGRARAGLGIELHGVPVGKGKARDYRGP